MTANRTRGRPRHPQNDQAGGFDQKRIESERISAQIAAFEDDGGRIEKLGTTRVLQKIDAVATTGGAPAGPGKSRS